MIIGFVDNSKSSDFGWMDVHSSSSSFSIIS
jgi:hypothetical protein